MGDSRCLTYTDRPAVHIIGTVDEIITETAVNLSLGSLPTVLAHQEGHSEENLLDKAGRSTGDVGPYQSRMN